MRNLFFLLITFSLVIHPFGNASGQQNINNMETKEKTTELNYYENPRYQGKPNFFVADDGNYVYHCTISVDEYTRPDDFRLIQKNYYRNGEPKQIIIFSLGFWISEETFDENGYVTGKRAPEPSEKKIEGMDYASFFEKEGWFDRKTGRTAFRKEPFPTNTGEFTREVFHNITFHSSAKNPTVEKISISGISQIPLPFLKKYGKPADDGEYYLDGRKPTSKWEKGRGIGQLEITYTVNKETREYEVSWEYRTKKE